MDSNIKDTAKAKEKKENPVKKYIKAFKGMGFLLKYYTMYGKPFIVHNLVRTFVFQPIWTAFYALWSKIIIDGIEQGKSFWQIAATMGICCGIILITYIIQNIWYSCFHFKFLTKMYGHLNTVIYTKAIKTDYKYFDNPEFYDGFTWTINQFANKCISAMNAVFNLLQSFVAISTLVTIMISLEPVMILFSLLPIFVLSWLNMRESKIKYEQEAEELSVNRRSGYIHRIFYLKEWAAGVKSTNIGDYYMNEYHTQVDNGVKIVDKFKFRKLRNGLASNSFETAYDFAKYIYLTWRIITGSLSLGGFIPLVNATSNLRWYCEDFFKIFKSSFEYGQYVEKIKMFLDTPSDIEVQDPDTLAELPTKPFEITFDDVSFGYESSNFGLKHINLTIPAGGRIAIVGENGAGKTTLTKLLLRLYDPQEGTIKINGRPISDYPVCELRRDIGIAFQDSPIYAMPLRDNMCLYGKADDDKLMEIARMFGLDKVMEKTGTTLDSQVTREFAEDGLELSGGEKQRLALARLFVKDFGLIILDEPSAALDPLAEYELNKIVFSQKFSATTVLISHRLSTVVDADCIILVDNGEIKEIGTHAELMRLGGKYADMFTKQAENYIKVSS